MKYLLLLSSLVAFCQTKDGAPRQLATGTTLPSTCVVGETFFKSDATAGQNLYGCTATNTWTLEAGGSISVVNAQTGTTYTVLTGDSGKLITFSNASSIAVTLPQAGGSFPDGWTTYVKNIGAGDVTITPTISTISGAASIVLSLGEYGIITSNGTNYEARTNRNVAGTNVTLTKSRTGVTFTAAGATDISGLTDLQVTRTSSTVLNIAAGKSRTGTVVTSYSAMTGTLSGSSTSSTAYIYEYLGVVYIGHNGATTLTCSGCTTVTSVTAFPAGSTPIATATYTSAAWDVSGITDKRTLTTRSVLTAGSGISITENAGGDQSIAQAATPITVAAYFPLGSTTANGGNGTTVFSANETRWQMFTLTKDITFSKMLVYANTGIGASKGIKGAIANTSGTILYTTATLTTCASTTICAMLFSSAITLAPGQYFYGITTDSTAFTVYQEHFAYNNLAYGMQLATGASIITMGQGTAGSGTAGSVAFGASMGTLTKWTGTDPVGKAIVVAFDN